MILALDQSTYKTGWAVFDTELIDYGLLILPKIKLDNGTERAQNRSQMLSFIQQTIDRYPIDTIVVEGTYLSSAAKMNPLVFSVLVSMKSSIEDYCFSRLIRLFEFKTASEWRKVLQFPFNENGKRLKSEDFKQKAKQLIV